MFLGYGIIRINWFISLLDGAKRSLYGEVIKNAIKNCRSETKAKNFI